MNDRPLSEAFNVLADYCLAQDWVPIGFRTFTVGPWEITVNGTGTRTDDIEPYHARIVHRDMVAIIIMHPFGGSVGGWKGAEDQFIADLKAAML